MYSLLSELVRVGPTADLRTEIDTLPAFDGVDFETDSDEIAAAHHALFGFNVFPHASVYLAEDGLLGGDVSATVRAYYDDWGPFADEQREAVDHLTTELLFCAATHDDPRHRSRFLDDHIFSWLPVFVHAVERRNNPFYARLARLTLDIAVKDRMSLPGLGGIPDMSLSAVKTMDPDSVSWRDLSDHFSSTHACGLFLSRGDIQDVARRHNIPSGFGGRAQMLQTVFDSSLAYDQEHGLLAALRDLCDQELKAWTTIVSDDAPGAVKYWSREWSIRLVRSREALARFDPTAG